MAQVLAPQLQQSLALLQAPTLELRALVTQEMQQNVVLEEVPDINQEIDQEDRKREEERDTPEPVDLAEPPADVKYDPATEPPANEPVDDFQAEFERLAQLDQEWRDHFSQTSVPNRTSAEDEEKRAFMFESLVAETSLQEFLMEQLRMSDLPASQMQVGVMLVGNIDDYGYLQLKLEDIASSTGVPLEQLQEILKLIQGFHPPGVGARDLRECLLLQLERAGRTESLEYRIIRDHMESLGKRRLPEIARQTGTHVEEVQEAAERISHLEPRPGRAFLPDNQQYVVPEVFIQKVGDDYQATTNDEQIPHLRISNIYKDMMANPATSEADREYIRDKIRAGKFLIKSIHQRQETILKIANEIIKRQREFLDKGVTHLKPMTMVQIAEVVGVHETTVSRAVSGKYVQTPHGVFEMKFFFTSGVKTADGGDLSNTSVKEMLLELVKSEPPSAPYSDDQIVKLLAEKNIVLARRTVAKYRSELNILPSNLRRVY